jgi:chromate transporter
MAEGATDPVQAHPDAASRPAGIPSLAALFGVLARDANLTFGGGSATIAVLHREIVVRRGWISELKFPLAYALSRLTPGTNLLAFCAAVGWLTRGWRGAVVALLGASLPCAIVAAIVTHFYEVLEHNALFRAGLRGALAAAVAVMASTAWVLARPYARLRLKPIVVVSGAVCLATLGSFSPFQVLLTAAIVGALWPTEAPKP